MSNYTILQGSGIRRRAFSDPVETLLSFPCKAARIQCSDADALEALIGAALSLKWPYCISARLGSGYQYVGFSHDPALLVTIEKRPATYPWQRRPQRRTLRIANAA